MAEILEQRIELKSGYSIPVLGLGTWQLTGQRCEQAVQRALELGYRHIDTAEAYRNEKEVGRALRGFDREEVFLTSKVPPEKLHFKDLTRACEASLERLGMDYLDLYLVHWPNERIEIKETMDAMNELVQRGLVRSIGVSNFERDRIGEAIGVSESPIVNDQVEFHPFSHRDELLGFCRSNGITVTAYSPLARGRVFMNDTINGIAREHGRSPAQVSLRWLLQKGAVVIPKAGSEEHLRENLELSDFSLSAEEMASIDEIPESRIIDVS